MDRAVAGEESIIWFNVSPRLSDGMSDGCGRILLWCYLKTDGLRWLIEATVLAKKTTNYAISWSKNIDYFEKKKYNDDWGFLC